MIPLFEYYPQLQDKVPHIPLCALPTPIERLATAGQDMGCELYVKRDDLSSVIYGGNKPRKLEFLFGEALARGAKEVLTFGFAGSNHALATSLLASQAHLRSISMLLNQPNAEYVRRNLEMGFAVGAELHHYETLQSRRFGTIVQMARHRVATGRFPYVIPLGGSSPLGTVGFVNAAFELLQQIEQGLVPEPEWVYLPLGSMGTAVGLCLGLKAAGLRCRVAGVNVVGETMATLEKASKLFTETNTLISTLDPSFPRFEFDTDDLVVREGFLGKGYAHFTEQGMSAIDYLSRHEDIELDGTYSGKAFAALLADARVGSMLGTVVLFWNTYNSREQPSPPMSGYRELPAAFHRYFEQDVQDLDADELGQASNREPPP